MMHRKYFSMCYSTSLQIEVFCVITRLTFSRAILLIISFNKFAKKIFSLISHEQSVIFKNIASPLHTAIKCMKRLLYDFFHPSFVLLTPLSF